MRICAAIVSYNPNIIALIKEVRIVFSQVDRLIIIDNGTTPSTLNRVRQELNKLNITLIELGENKGVAAAHNVGIDWARKNCFTHILLLDHDSIPSPNMVDQLKSAAQFLSKIYNKIAALGPRYLHPESHHSSYFVQLGNFSYRKIYCKRQQFTPIQVDFLISSGCLIPLSAVDVIGKMDESLFIDHVDTDWFFRARHHGYVSFGICNAIMHHAIGDYTLKLFKGRIHVSVHQPLRHYYLFRNSVLLYQRPYTPWQWIIGDVIKMLAIIIIFSVRSPQRTAHLTMILKGIWHGIKRVGGKYSS